jgi:hypothetical protein
VLNLPTLSPAGVVGLSWAAVPAPAGTTIRYVVNINGVPQPSITALTYNYTPILAALQAGLSISVQAVATATATSLTTLGSTISVISNVQTVKATAPLAAGVPPGLAATIAAATGAVTLNWTAVAPATGTTITYLVSVNGAAGVPATRGGALALALGSSYTVSVASVATEFGLSTPSAYSTPITVDLTAAATPNAPATLTVNATTLTWTAPAALAGTGSTNVTYTYNVQKSVDGGVTWTLLTAAPITALTLAAASPVGTNYQYQVQAIATRYGLPASTPSAGKTTVFNTAPAASTTPVATQGAVGSSAITVAWTNPSTNITGWTVTRRVAAGAWLPFTPTTALPLTGGSYSFTDTGLTVGTNYTYRVTATSLGGTTAVATSNQVTAR